MLDQQTINRMNLLCLDLFSGVVKKTNFYFLERDYRVWLPTPTNAVLMNFLYPNTAYNQADQELMFFQRDRVWEITMLKRTKQEYREISYAHQNQTDAAPIFIEVKINCRDVDAISQFVELCVIGAKELIDTAVFQKLEQPIFEAC